MHKIIFFLALLSYNGYYNVPFLIYTQSQFGSLNQGRCGECGDEVKKFKNQYYFFPVLILKIVIIYDFV